MKMKKMTSFLISTVMVLCLAGCGSQNTQGSQSGQNSASTVQAAGGSAETQSTSVSEQPDTAESTAEALPDVSTEEASEPSQTENETDIADSESESGKTLVVYYSATGTTKNVANYIASVTGADLFELSKYGSISLGLPRW